MGLSNKIETNVNLLKSEAQSTGRVILHVDMWLINSYYWVPLNGPKLTHHYLFIFFSSLFCFLQDKFGGSAAGLRRKGMSTFSSMR